MHHIQSTAAVLLLGISASLSAQTTVVWFPNALSPDVHPVVPIVFSSQWVNVRSINPLAVRPSLDTATSRSAAVVVREVAPANATSSTVFRNIFQVRETSGGHVLLNDGLARQLVLLDAKLSNPTVVLDSVKEGGQAYGTYAQPILRYFGDSTIHLDVPSRSMLVLDGRGKVVRTMALPKQTDFGRMFVEGSAVDPFGNLWYRGYGLTIADTATSNDGTFTRKSHPSDSLGIVRANFQTRSVDTLARVKQDGSTTALQTTKFDGTKFLHVWLNPLTAIDEWAVLSDGTVALVRGRDYHVDWVLPDGTARSTEKLPFDWKRMSDEDKQHLTDSVRTAIEKTRTVAEETGGAIAGNDAVVNFLRNAATPTSRPIGNPPTSLPKVVEPTVTYSFAELKDIPDYFPAIRLGSTTADEDGNLWLLPTTSAQSKHGELVYDVVHPHTTNFYRVRMPVGRSIAGFGKNGVIYLRYRNGTEWHLERTRVESTVSAK